MKAKVKFPNPIDMTQNDYVKRRFEDMPKEVVHYFDIGDGGHVNGRAHLEVLFRAEYHYYRLCKLQDISIELYRKYQASLMVIETAKTKPHFDLDVEMAAAMEAVGVPDFIPEDF